VRAARSPMTRVAKVLWAAGQGARRKALRVRRQREKEARARSGFSGCDPKPECVGVCVGGVFGGVWAAAREGGARAERLQRVRRGAALGGAPAQPLLGLTTPIHTQLLIGPYTGLDALALKRILSAPAATGLIKLAVGASVSSNDRG